VENNRRPEGQGPGAFFPNLGTGSADRAVVLVMVGKKIRKGTAHAPDGARSTGARPGGGWVPGRAFHAFRRALQARWDSRSASRSDLFHRRGHVPPSGSSWRFSNPPPPRSASRGVLPTFDGVALDVRAAERPARAFLDMEIASAPLSSPAGVRGPPARAGELLLVLRGTCFLGRKKKTRGRILPLGLGRAAPSRCCWAAHIQHEPGGRDHHAVAPNLYGANTAGSTTRSCQLRATSRSSVVTCIDGPSDGARGATARRLGIEAIASFIGPAPWGDAAEP